MKSVGLDELLAMCRRFQSHQEYTSLKTSCESAATEWRWATSFMLPEIPHQDTVNGLKPAKWAKKQPRHGSLHGLDSLGRVQCMRSDEHTKPDGEVHEQFLIYEDDGFWCLFFSNTPQKKVLTVRWYEVSGGRWTRLLQIRYEGVAEKLIEWEGDRLAKYTDRSWSEISIRNLETAGSANLESEPSGQCDYLYSYAPDGELDRVVEEYLPSDDEPPLRAVTYQRVPKGVSLDVLLTEAEDLLVSEIPKAIEATHVPEPVYALLMQFTGVDTDPGGFPPPLLMPPESLRRRLVAEHPKDATWYPWAVPEWETDPAVVKAACANPALDEKLQLIFQLTIGGASQTKYGPVRKMFQRVCARLNAHPWAKTLKITDDFVVLPFDPHGELDQKVDLKASVPVDKLKLLMEHGYIKRFKLQ